MLQERDDIVALDSAIILHPRTWEASGHLASFTDPLVDCRTCKHRFRADHLDALACGRKPSMHPGEFAECDLTEARDFNLMFETHDRPGARRRLARSTCGPRPRRASSSTSRTCSSSRGGKPPFGIAQIGKSFRNEITPGQLPLPHARVRADGDGVLRAARRGRRVVRVLDRAAARAGTSSWACARATCACGRTTPTSSRTTPRRRATSSTCSRSAGRSSRGSPTAATSTCARTREYSGETLEYFDQQSGERYVPHVIEPAAGADRATLAFLVDAYDEEEVEGETRTLLRLHPRLAPVKVAVLPLMRRDGQPELAREIHHELRATLQCEYDDGGSIGRRYRRQDEIGTPWCVTIDHQTLEDRTVTMRDRDTLAQERIPIDELAGELSRRLAAPWRTPKPD